MEKIDVVILGCGRKAKEIMNREKPEYYGDTGFLSALLIAGYEYDKKNLRTFDIDFSHWDSVFQSIEKKVGGKITHINMGFKPRTKHKAKILDNGAVKILSKKAKK